MRRTSLSTKLTLSLMLGTAAIVAVFAVPGPAKGEGEARAASATQPPVNDGLPKYKDMPSEFGGTSDQESLGSWDFHQ